MNEIRNVEHLQAFVVELIKFRNLVRCRICLDIANSPVQFECQHTFCLACLEAYADETVPRNACPICRKVTSRRPRKTSENIKNLSKFVVATGNKIKEIFGTDFTDLTSVEKINSILRKKVDANNPDQNSSSSGLIPATVVHSCATATGEDDENAFDVLMQSSMPNSQFTKKPTRTYQARKTVKKQLDTYDKLIDFEDDKTKTKIQEWLNNNRNRFDRITQSQQDLTEQSDVSGELEMISVSQTSDKNDKIAVGGKVGMRRARSLDVMIKRCSRRPQVQRHTFGGEPETLTIEEVESESDKQAHEKAIHLLEEECLNNLDLEMSKGVVKKSKKTKRRNSGGKPQTGWSRMKETNKKVKGRKPVQLCSVPPSAKKRVEIASKKAEPSTERVYDLDMFELYTNDILKSDCESTDIERVPEVNKERTSKNCEDKVTNEDFICRTTQLSETDRKNAIVGTLFSSEPNITVELNNDIFMEPTQKLDIADITSYVNNNDSIEDKLAAIFSSPRKREANIGSTNHKNETLRNKIDFGCSILNDFDNFIMKCGVDSTQVTTELQAYIFKLKNVFDDLKQLRETSKSTSTALSSPDLFLSKKSPDQLNVTTQTLNLDFKSVAIQTIKSPGFRISSNEAFKTQVNHDVGAQTETIRCYNCVCGCAGKNIEDIHGVQSDVIVTHAEITKQPVEKYEFTQSLDDVKFDTQDVIRNSVRKQLPLVSQCKDVEDVNEAMVNVIDEEADEIKRNVQNSLASGVNRKLIFPELGKKYKRIRPPNSDSDSDDGMPKKVRKVKNKFTRDDLSIRFESGTVGTASAGEQAKEDLFVASDGSDNINYDEYLEQIMKKYDKLLDNKVDETPKIDAVKKQSDSQNVIDKCEATIKNATINEENKTTAPLQLRSINSPVEEPTSKKRKFENFSESLFPITVNATASQYPNEKPNADAVIDEFKKHLNDGFDGELEQIDNPETPVVQNVKVKILQNIVLGNENVGDVTTSELRYNLDDELERLDRNEGVTSLSQEIFSQSDDVDIVETTPQKSNSRKLMSQSFSQREDVLGDPFCIPPPVEFQDEFELDIQNEQNDLNLTDLDATLVPLKPKVDDETKDTVIEVDDFTQLSVRCKSVYVYQELNISPIKPEKQIVNPIAYAQNSRFSPLDVVAKKPASVSTSTPKQKSILSYVMNSQKPSRLTTQESSPKKPCVACTRLSKEHIVTISTLKNNGMATYSNIFDSSVTHMIVMADEKNRLKDHTMKYILAVAAGLWVVSFEWVRECLAQGRIVPEEPYEVLDVSGLPGPKTSRLTRMKHPLLKGYKIYASPPFQSTSKEDLETVVKLLGGQVVPHLDCFQKKDATCLIIMEAKDTQDYELCEARLESLKVLTVDIEWLSRSVGQFRLLGLQPFALCWDDAICATTYPSQMLVNVSISFSERSA